MIPSHPCPECGISISGSVLCSWCAFNPPPDRHGRMKLVWEVQLREDDGAGVLSGYGPTAKAALADLHERLSSNATNAQDTAARVTAWSARVRGELEALSDG